MCSLSRSISTSPGISRSPVNSAKLILQLTLSAYARVHFDAAWQVHVAVDLGFGAAHLQRDGVIDPIAHLVTQECAVGNRRGERERRWIKFGQIDVEIHRDDISCLERSQFVTFARRVSAGKIHAKLV